MYQGGPTVTAVRKKHKRWASIPLAVSPTLSCVCLDLVPLVGLRECTSSSSCVCVLRMM